MALRIFLVEDNPVIRQALAETFQELLAAEIVAWADTEEDGVKFLRSTPDGWDIAVVDLFLRTGSGLGVARAVISRLPHQRVYVVSNYSTPDLKERCSRVGVDDVFDKSTELDRLLEVLGASI